VETTLATAAPITVPATPKNEAITAADTAARAPAATCSALSWPSFFSRGDSSRADEAGVRTSGSVRGTVMSSGGSSV
jgi:hypothetical protein